MDEQPQDQSQKQRPVMSAWWLLALVLALYPLSFGPVVFVFVVCHEPQWMEAALRVIYTPLMFACNSHPLVGEWTQAYAEAAYNAAIRCR